MRVGHSTHARLVVTPVWFSKQIWKVYKKLAPHLRCDSLIQFHFTQRKSWQNNGAHILKLWSSLFISWEQTWRDSTTLPRMRPAIPGLIHQWFWKRSVCCLLKTQRNISFFVPNRTVEADTCLVCSSRGLLNILNMCLDMSRHPQFNSSSCLHPCPSSQGILRLCPGTEKSNYLITGISHGLFPLLTPTYKPPPPNLLPSSFTSPARHLFHSTWAR